MQVELADLSVFELRVVELDDELFVSEFAPGEGVVVEDVGDQPPLIAKHTVVPVDQRTLRLVELLVYPLVALLVIPKVEQMTVQSAC